MKSIVLLPLFFLLVLTSYSQVKFSTPTFSIQLNQKGQLVSMMDLVHGHEYLHPDTTAVLLQVKTDGKWEAPLSIKFVDATQTITVTYPSHITITVKAVAKNTHLTFEITDAKPMAKIDRVMWGSYPTTIGKIVGEIIGVVRDDQFAIGIQALNLKTTGGYPWNDEGYDLLRGSAALAKPWGSVLQAYSINRALPRKIAVRNGDFQNMPVEPLPNETVVGSRIALFGVTVGDALATIGKIELAEGLPHPVYKDQWIKQSPEQGRSYIISDFTEADVDEMIIHVQRSGLMSLYHEGPFKSWGKYEFSPKYFPNGKEGVKLAVKKAHAAGIHFGVHTLTNFINTDDPYVTPVPDDRLVRTGSSRLTSSISATSSEIPLVAPEYFNEEKNNVLHLVKIGKELIRYRSVTGTTPYRLMECQRGAFGTTASEHATGSEVSKLLDHGYEVVFPSIPMQNEISKNLALMFNETGIDHLDFDGHEGGLASGQGDYGIEAFSKTFYDNADHFVVNGTSNSKHFYWHMNTYCNWGEPWYGGFRESMQEYRIANQGLFERNFMPHMMGWYLMTGTTSLPDMEWMLARAAGYQAGFAMVLRVRDARKNPNRDQLLDAIREWEAARRANAFSPEQRKRLQDIKNEFHLEKSGEAEWKLYPYHSSEAFVHERKDLQPGEPTYSLWNFTNPDENQPLQFMIEVQGKDGEITNPELTLDQFTGILIPVTLKAGERLIVDGTNLARVYDSKGKQRATENISKVPTLGPGSHTAKFKASFGTEDTPPRVVLNFKTLGKSEVVRKP